MKNKIKTFATIIVFSMIVFVGCKKENNKPNNASSSAPTTGTLYFMNNQTDSYNVYLDGTYIGILVGNKVSTKGYTISSGIPHGVKAVQYSYIITPTIFTGSATVNPGGTITWSF